MKVHEFLSYAVVRGQMSKGTVRLDFRGYAMGKRSWFVLQMVEYGELCIGTVWEN